MQPSGQDLARLDVVTCEIKAAHVTAIARSDLARGAPKTAADIEYTIRRREGQLPCDFPGHSASADMKLVYRREVFGRDRAFGLAHAGQTVANRRDQIIPRVMVSDP